MDAQMDTCHPDGHLFLSSRGRSAKSSYRALNWTRSRRN